MGMRHWTSPYQGRDRTHARADKSAAKRHPRSSESRHKHDGCRGPARAHVHLSRRANLRAQLPDRRCPHRSPDLCIRHDHPRHTVIAQDVTSWCRNGHEKNDGAGRQSRPPRSVRWTTRRSRSCDSCAFVSVATISQKNHARPLAMRCGRQSSDEQRRRPAILNISGMSGMEAVK
jgi:hypothetical protein